MPKSSHETMIILIIASSVAELSLIDREVQG